MSPDTQLLRTALHPNHVAANGRMVPFAGWDMPVQYEGVLAEAKVVRSAVGIFDVSHMGRLYIDGVDSGDFLESILTFSVKSLKPGRARYGFLLTEDGGIIDDAVVYQQSAKDGSNERYLLICNAANRESVTAWINQHMTGFPDVSMTDFTTESIMIAVQGPAAARATFLARAPRTRAASSTSSAPPSPTRHSCSATDRLKPAISTAI